MIVSFRSKALKHLWENNDERGVNAQHLDKIWRMLAALDETVSPEDISIPSYKLH